MLAKSPRCYTVWAIEEADDVLTTTGISAADRKKYEKVIEKFDRFYDVRTNIIYERARFNRRNQEPGESVEQYITTLHRLAETCGYGDLKDEMLRDRLVVGIRDIAMSEKLQFESNLTLDKAMKMIRQKEAVKDQQGKLLGDGSKANPIVVDELNRQQRLPRKPPRNASGKDKKAKGGVKPDGKCKRCGGKTHLIRETCPAKTANCHRCNRRGHFSSQCLSKTVATTTSQELPVDTLFLDAVNSKASKSTEWQTTIKIEDKIVSVKMDTGAEVMAISKETFKQLNGARLSKSSRVLQGLTGHPLQTPGQFTGTLQSEGRRCQQQIFVVRGLRTNLLGLPAITSLHLATRLNSVNEPGKEEIQAEYPKLFQGLGTLGEPYSIKVRQDAKLYTLYTPRNIPIPMRTKVKEGLIRMENMGVISKITQPTQWCAGMVVVPKSSGAVRICVDLKMLNQSVLREPHPIPAVDDTLACLTGASIFSKVDANSGFWQIPLSEDTKYYTTFITPYGRYCFNKLPFGVSSAPELFQSRMS